MGNWLELTLNPDYRGLRRVKWLSFPRPMVTSLIDPFVLFPHFLTRRTGTHALNSKCDTITYPCLQQASRSKQIIMIIIQTDFFFYKNWPRHSQSMKKKRKQYTFSYYSVQMSNITRQHQRLTNSIVILVPQGTRWWGSKQAGHLAGFDAEQCESADRKCATVTLSTLATALALTKCTKHCFFFLTTNIHTDTGSRRLQVSNGFKGLKEPPFGKSIGLHKPLQKSPICDIKSGSLPRYMKDIEQPASLLSGLYKLVWSDQSIMHLDWHRILDFYMACNC